jgi:phosphocarrier protein HPr
MSSGVREPSLKGSFVIQNRLGLHARAAALFVQSVTALDADVFVSKDGETVNGKSIMGLMMLAAGKGSSIEVEARGPAAEDALRAVETLIADRFREPE